MKFTHLNVSKSLCLVGAASLDQNAIAFAVELLRTVMVPRGTVINPEPTVFPEGDFTQWATIRDHKNLIYYFWTAWNPTLQKLDLKQLNEQQVTAKHIPTNQPNWCSDVTSEMIHQRASA